MSYPYLYTWLNQTVQLRMKNFHETVEVEDTQAISVPAQ